VNPDDAHAESFRFALPAAVLLARAPMPGSDGVVRDPPDTAPHPAYLLTASFATVNFNL